MPEPWGFRAPMIVLCPPVVKDRFERVSAGPRTYTFMDSNAVAVRYCLTNPYFYNGKSRYCNHKSQTDVVEPAFVEPECQRARFRVGIATDRSRPSRQRVKLKFITSSKWSEQGDWRLGQKRCRCLSKVCLLVKYVSACKPQTVDPRGRGNLEGSIVPAVRR